MFVRACRALLKPHITLIELEEAHQHLKLFNNTFQNLLGSEYCTPNMHMQMHFKDCVLDFGPVYAFWCYSFERFNGILGSYPTNNRSITEQLMRKFNESHSVIAAYDKIGLEVPSLQDMKLQTLVDSALSNILPIYTYRVIRELSQSLLLKEYHSFLSGGKLKRQDDVQCITILLKQYFPNYDLLVEHIV